MDIVMLKCEQQFVKKINYVYIPKDMHRIEPSIRTTRKEMTLMQACRAYYINGRFIPFEPLEIPDTFKGAC